MTRSRNLTATATSLAFAFILTARLEGQGLEITIRPNLVFAEPVGGRVVPVERTFFHVIFHNRTPAPMDLNWVRFDLISKDGSVTSFQNSGQSLKNLFDGSMDRRRIEPTPRGSLTIAPDSRKAVSDVMLELPAGFVGDTLVIESEFRTGSTTQSAKTSAPIRRSPVFTGRLPFDGIWYVSEEHGPLDSHKRFVAEAFAYDFLQVGGNGKTYISDGTRNSDYFVWGKRVLAAKDGQVVFVRGDVADNPPGAPKTNQPEGNVVIVDHGSNQFAVYAHLRSGSVSLRPGARVRAGEPLGEVGNSGDSAEPHLHFHVMNSADPAAGEGIPILIDSWKSQAYSAQPIARRDSVIPKGEFVQP